MTDEYLAGIMAKTDTAQEQEAVAWAPPGFTLVPSPATEDRG